MRRLVAVLVTWGIAACTAGPRVTVGGEALTGKRLAPAGVSAFLGVPFAAAPVGDLRWQAPRPYRARGTTRDATSFAPACMQTPRIVEWYREMVALGGADPDVFPAPAVSEDCLYLNVWTPRLDPGARLPVMVFVHGGSNRSGWSYEPNYDGHALAQEGVVVVSVAYRLGDFGFFAHPDLASGPAVANFGLWDLLAALNWVQDHIEKFGGDAQRVTVFGESAGAGNIAALMFAPAADDLFARAILQSSSDLGIDDMRTLADERQRGARLAAALGAQRPLSIDALRRIPADAFLRRSEAVRDGYYHAPVADGALIEGPVGARLKSGRFKARPVIVGTNANEWYASVPADAGTAYLSATASSLYGEHSRAALAQVAQETDARYAADRLHTAAEMLCPSQWFAEAVSGTGSGAWVYRFSRRRAGAVGDAWRAYHGAELPYVFGTHDAWLVTTSADRSIGADVMAWWTAFARSGDPNGEGAPRWPRFTAPGYAVLDIDEESAPINRPDLALCELYRKSLAVDDDAAVTVGAAPTTTGRCHPCTNI